MAEFDVSDLFDDDNSVAVAETEEAETEILPEVEIDADDGPQPDEVDGDDSDEPPEAEQPAESVRDYAEEIQQLEHSISRVSVEIARLQASTKSKKKYLETLIEELAGIIDQGTEESTASSSGDNSADKDPPSGLMQLAENEILVRVKNDLQEMKHPGTGEDMSVSAGDELMLTIDGDGLPYFTVDGFPEDVLYLEWDEFEIVVDGREQAVNNASPESEWRNVWLTTLGINAGILESLAEAGIETIGQVSDYCADGKQLTSINKIGPSKAEKIEAALEDYWKGSAK